MAGLVPKRRSRSELERANATLLEKHKDHLRTWVASKRAASKSESEKSKRSTDSGEQSTLDCR